MASTLNSYVGCENVTAITRKAHATGRSVYDLVLAKGLLTKAQLDDILRPEILTQPRPLPERKGKRKDPKGLQTLGSRFA